MMKNPYPKDSHDPIDHLCRKCWQQGHDSRNEEVATLTATIKRHKQGFAKDDNEVQQLLGKALGYPWFKDDQKHFPGATEADGVFVGEHVAVTIAMEAARKIVDLTAKLEEANRLLAQGPCGVPGHRVADWVEFFICCNCFEEDHAHHPTDEPIGSTFVCTACAAIAKAKDDALVEASDLSCFGCGRNLTYSLDRLRRPL